MAVTCLALAWRLAGGLDVRSLSQLQPGALLLAVLAFGAGYACRIRRWQTLLQPLNAELRWSDCAGPLLAGVALNNLLPLRAGDILRATAYRQRLGVPTTALVGSLLVERLLDLSTLLVIAGVAVAALWSWDAGGTRTPLPSIWKAGGAAIAGPLGALGLLVLLVAVVVLLAVRALRIRSASSGSPGCRPLRLWRLLERLVRLWPGGAGAVSSGLQQGRTTLRAMLRPGAIPALAGWTLAAWVFEGGVFWFTATAMPALSAPAGAWLAWPLATLATLVPGSPGHVGTFDLAAQQAMAWAGNAPAQALSYALVVHLALWLPATLAGALCLAVQAARGPERR